MRVVWAREPITASEIIDELSRSKQRSHPKTTRTLLARLVKKGALEHQLQGRVYAYKARVTERECVAFASNTFLDRVFGGALKPMLAHFAEEKKLTKKDLQELRDLLEKKGRKRS